MSSMRTIRVTGKGQIKVKPDTTRLTISLEGTYPEYGEALRHSSLDTEQLKDILSAFDFQRSDLKTLNFNVETEYESYKVNGSYKQRFIGYKFHHMMKVEFPSDNVRLEGAVRSGQLPDQAGVSTELYSFRSGNSEK